jgi:muramoyltetrapeptide carboxypeptidase
MLQQLLASGALVGVAGLAYGRFTGAPDEDEHSVADVLAEVAQRLAVPAVVDLPFGHTEHNCTVPVGVRARLDGDAATLQILEAGVRYR